MLEKKLEEYKKRYDSLSVATEKLQKQYIEAMQINISLTQQIVGKDTVIETKQNTIQLLATEQNTQEQRHSTQVEELMSRIRVLEGRLNDN